MNSWYNLSLNTQCESLEEACDSIPLRHPLHQSRTCLDHDNLFRVLLVDNIKAGPTIYGPIFSWQSLLHFFGLFVHIVHANRVSRFWYWLWHFISILEGKQRNRLLFMSEIQSPFCILVGFLGPNSHFVLWLMC